MNHQQLFGHLAEDEFTAAQAVEYLDISMSTFRRYIASARAARKFNGGAQPDVQGGIPEGFGNAQGLNASCVAASNTAVHVPDPAQKPASLHQN